MLQKQPEEPKRQAKIDFLGALETKITSNDRSELSIPNQTCQSFFRAVGDTEDLIQATKQYFQYAQG